MTNTNRIGRFATAVTASCALAMAGTITARAGDDHASRDDHASKAAPAVSRAAAGWPATAGPTHRLKEPGLPNFGKANDYLWRSGQPNRRGYERLKEMGVRTVVNLRSEYGDEEKELKEVAPNVRYVWLPVKDERAPSPETAEAFLRIVSDPDNWPILVHCHGGEGRAGVMCALVRYSFDGWDDKAIMKEVGNFRTAHLGFIRIPMASSQRRFIREWEASHEPAAYRSRIGANSESKPVAERGAAPPAAPAPAGSGASH